MKLSDSTIWLLNDEAARYNTPAFVADDPVQFPRLFTDVRDIEIVSLLVSSIAWGKRSMILRDAARMLGMMDNRPYDYMMSQAYEALADGQNIHRTFFCGNLKHYLRGLRTIYKMFGSLEAMAVANGVGEELYPAWALAGHINRYLSAANDGVGDSRCMPQNLDTTALKRLNMALRWLVRNDDIVDLGVWTAIKPSQLYIPLDVHVGNVSRQLGLLGRKGNDRRAVLELTACLRGLRPHDPAWYDYALFGIGVNAK